MQKRSTIFRFGEETVNEATSWPDKGHTDRSTRQTDGTKHAADPKRPIRPVDPGAKQPKGKLLFTRFSQ